MRRLTAGLSVPLMAGAVMLVGVAAAQPAPDREITATSMGPATLGNTETGLAVELGSSYTLTPGVTPFVDLEGAEVSQGGVTQFYALRSSGEGPELTVFITDNSEYQLASGIGPGATVDDAVAAYGAATVSFNTDNESREFAVFDRGPAGRVQFQVEGPTAGETAGNYDPVADGFNETTDIRPGSVVTPSGSTASAANVLPLNSPTRALATSRRSWRSSARRW